MTLMRRILSEKRVLLVSVAFLLLADLVIYGLAVAPWSNRLAEADAQVRAVEALLAETRRSHETAARAGEIRMTTDRGLDYFYGEVLPKSLSEARALLSPFLETLADDSGLVLERRNNVLEREAGNILTKLSTTMVLSGAYESIRHLIFALETSKEFILIEEIVLGQADEASGRLVLTLSTSTYFREEVEI